MAFQKGQKVRSLQDVFYDKYNQITKGEIYTVSASLGDFVVVEGVPRPWYIARFEPVVEVNPYVETVTKTVEKIVTEEIAEERLKPGTYGAVVISDTGVIYHQDKAGFVSYFNTTDLDETISALMAIRSFRAAQKK